MPKARPSRRGARVRRKVTRQTWGAWLRGNFDAWAQFALDNADKLLLFGCFFVLILLVLHVSHDGKDESLVSWAREQTGTVLGALLGLITGAALRHKRKS